MSLLQLFDKIEVKPTDGLTEADKAEVERITAAYTTCYEKTVLSFHTFSAFADRELPQVGDRGLFHYQIDDLHKGIQKIDDELIPKINENFVHYIESYFQKTYKISFTSLDIRTQKSKYGHLEITHGKIEADDIIKNMIKQCGKDLTATGINKLKSDFRNSLYWKGAAEIKGDCVMLISYAYYDGWNGFKLSYGSGRDKAILLTNALYYFENKQLNTGNQCINSLLNTWSDNVDFSMVYDFPIFEKIKSIRFFKNNKVKIKFKNSVIANEFYNCFDIDSLKSKEY